MNTKIVYVLTSDAGDMYLEMTLMSVFTAKHFNPSAEIVLVTDKPTLDSCDSGYRCSFLRFFSQVVTVDTSAFPTKALRSRFLKTSLRQTIEGDFLYIDSDTIICRNLDDIDNTPHEIAAVLDIHLDKQNRWLFHEVEGLESLIGGSNAENLFNCGVLYVKDVEKNQVFFNKWYELWFERSQNGLLVDQPPFHKAIEQTGITVGELDGTWNCQITANFLPFLVDARIIHTFTGGSLCNPYMLKGNYLPGKIKDNGGMTDDIKHILLNAKSAFEPLSITVGGSDVKLVNSKIYRRLRLLNEKSPLFIKLLIFVSAVGVAFVNLKSMIHFKSRSN